MFDTIPLSRFAVCSQGTTAEAVDELPDNTCLKIVVEKPYVEKKKKRERFCISVSRMCVVGCNKNELLGVII